MAGSRTLKLSILADVADLKKNLDTGSKEVEGFGGCGGRNRANGRQRAEPRIALEERGKHQRSRGCAVAEDHLPHASQHLVNKRRQAGHVGVRG